VEQIRFKIVLTGEKKTTLNQLFNDRTGIENEYTFIFRKKRFVTHVDNS